MNFPTAEEEAFVEGEGMPVAGSVEKVPAAALKATAQGFKSDFIEVTWHKKSSQWIATITHNDKIHNLGMFDDEQVKTTPKLAGTRWRGAV